MENQGNRDLQNEYQKNNPNIWKWKFIYTVVNFIRFVNEVFKKFKKISNLSLKIIALIEAYELISKAAPEGAEILIFAEIYWDVSLSSLVVEKNSQIICMINVIIERH